MFYQETEYRHETIIPFDRKSIYKYLKVVSSFLSSDETTIQSCLYISCASSRIGIGIGIGITAIHTPSFGISPVSEREWKPRQEMLSTSHLETGRMCAFTVLFQCRRGGWAWQSAMLWRTALCIRVFKVVRSEYVWIEGAEVYIINSIRLIACSFLFDKTV